MAELVEGLIVEKKGMTAYHQAVGRTSDSGRSGRLCAPRGGADEPSARLIRPPFDTSKEQSRIVGIALWSRELP